MADNEHEIVFMRDHDEEPNLADDPKIALLAVCIVSQQSAGYRDKQGNAVVDLRQTSCPECSSPGFNTGFGFWRCVCGAELLPEGELSEPCQKKKAS